MTPAFVNKSCSDCYCVTKSIREGITKDTNTKSDTFPNNNHTSYEQNLHKSLSTDWNWLQTTMNMLKNSSILQYCSQTQTPNSKTHDHNYIYSYGRVFFRKFSFSNMWTIKLSVSSWFHTVRNIQSTFAQDNLLSTSQLQRKHLHREIQEQK